MLSWIFLQSNNGKSNVFDNNKKLEVVAVTTIDENAPQYAWA